MVDVKREKIPDLKGDIRHLIPMLGLRNYWYPAIPGKKIGRKKPVQVKMLGEELALFRNKQGEVVVLTDVCPHRGARLSEGINHWPGLVSCPYHGWTFDGTGALVAVLSEGPTSGMPGMKGTEAKVYPSKELKGIVFVWIGEEEPAAIEEDVPEEFFNPKAHVFYNDTIIWGTNWEVALENSMDSHTNYLHRDHMGALMAAPALSPRVAAGERLRFTGYGFPGANAPRPGKAPPHDIYPELDIRWPKHTYRRLWGWFFAPILRLANVNQVPCENESWRGGHRLPGIFGGAPAPGQPVRRVRGQGQSFLFGNYRRWPVAIGEWQSRLWYFHGTLPKNRLQLLWYWFVYWGISRWLGEYNFSQQDMSVMPMQYYDKPEMLSITDQEVVHWRRLVVTKHFGGRNAPFEFGRMGGLTRKGDEDGEPAIETKTPQVA